MTITLSTFLDACDRGNEALVREGLRTHDLTIANGDGETPLIRALLHTQIDVAKLLVDGSNLRQTNQYGETPLMIALDHLGAKPEEGIVSKVRSDVDFSIVERLIPGSDLKHRNDKGRTPLMVLMGKEQILLLPTRQSSVSLSPAQLEDRAEREKVWFHKNHIAMERVFDQMLPGSDLKAEDNDGLTTLMIASDLHDSRWVGRLLDGSDAQQLDDFKRPALAHALIAGNMTTAQLLIPRTNLAQPDDQGALPLMWAAMYADLPTFMLILAQSPANALLQATESGRTPLILATRAGKLDIIRAIVERSNPEHLDEDGLNAQGWAYQKGHPEIVAFFIEREKALLRSMAKEDMAPLHRARARL